MGLKIQKDSIGEEIERGQGGNAETRTEIAGCFHSDACAFYDGMWKRSADRGRQ